MAFLSDIPKEAWGNRGGWITAGVIGTLVIALVLSIVSQGGVTATTDLGRDADRWSDLTLPPELDAVGDAGNGRLYRRLADQFASDASVRHPLSDLVDPRRRTAEPLDNLPLGDDLVAAASPGPAEVFADEPALLVNHTTNLKELYALDTIGRAAIRQASLLAARAVRDDDDVALDRAVELYGAAYALGRSLAEERLVFRQFQIGYRLMGDAIGGLAAIANKRGDNLRSAQLAAAGDALTAFINADVSPVWDAVGAPDTTIESDDRAGRHIGDVLAIAESDEAATMWRTNALLRLGVAKFTSPRPADRAAAERVVTRVAESADDELLHLAATASMELDRSGIRAAR